MFTSATDIGNQTRIKDLKTSTGIKDTYLDFFLDRMFTSYKKKRGITEKKKALDELVASLPECILSPVWRINGNVSYFIIVLDNHLLCFLFIGVDPHSDTPVEILHTILLGFVKYFWRDVVQNQLKNNMLKKELLKTRLSSFDVTGVRFCRPGQYKKPRIRIQGDSEK
jgi:hypothetical protein